MTPTRRSRLLRPFFEGVVLVSSLVAGAVVVGSCAVSTTGLERGLSVLAGLVFALVLVGAVFLFATMSRDLRLMRERLTTNGASGPPEGGPHVPEGTAHVLEGGPHVSRSGAEHDHE